MSKSASKNPIQIDSPREDESAIIDSESENPIQEESATSDSTPPSENPVLVSGNPFIEPNNIRETLDRVRYAIELAKFVSGVCGDEHLSYRNPVPEDAHMGVFYLLQGVGDVIEYVDNLLEAKKGTKPEPEESMVPA